MLAFAIIMLNTDAHNPLAERRLFRSDFVQMNSQPTTSPPPSQPPPATTSTSDAAPSSASIVATNDINTVTVYESVLPVEELEAIYERIVGREIRIKDDDVALMQAGAAAGGGGGANGAADQRSAASSLASALGIRAFNTPFKQKVAKGWTKDQKGLSDVERKRRLVELAERAVLSSSSQYEAGGQGSGRWLSSSHADLAR